MTKTIDDFRDEKAAEIAEGFFNDCGLAAKRKGKVLKVTGDEQTIDYLYHRFVFNVLLGN